MRVCVCGSFPEKGIDYHCTTPRLYIHVSLAACLMIASAAFPFDRVSSSSIHTPIRTQLHGSPPNATFSQPNATFSPPNATFSPPNATYSLLWYACYGMLWYVCFGMRAMCAMVYYGRLWYATVCYGMRALCAMVCVLWYACNVCYGMLWYAMVCYGKLS